MTGIPVAAGQSEHSRLGARDLIVDGAIDVCNFDASWGPPNGAGLPGWQPPSTSRWAITRKPSSRSTCWPPFHTGPTYAEAFSVQRDPIFWHMLANRPVSSDGGFALPQGGGFGWELDPAFIKKYRVDAG